MSDAERAARLRLLDIDLQVASEQYRQLRMESFKAELDMRMQQIKGKHAGGGEWAGAEAEKLTAIHEERLHLLERLSERTRRQVVQLHLEMAELEGAPGHGNKLDGEWIGRDLGKGTEIRLHVEGHHVRLESPAEGVWFEGEIAVEPEGEEYWEVTFEIGRCSNPEHQGKTCRGLARLEENRLVLAAHKPGNPNRPSSLEPGDGRSIFVFERK